MHFDRCVVVHACSIICMHACIVRFRVPSHGLAACMVPRSFVAASRMERLTVTNLQRAVRQARRRTLRRLQERLQEEGEEHLLLHHLVLATLEIVGERLEVQWAYELELLRQDIYAHMHACIVRFRVPSQHAYVCTTRHMHALSLV